MASPSIPRKLWEHPNPESSSMAHFRRAWEQELGVSIPVGSFLSSTKLDLLILLDLP